MPWVFKDFVGNDGVNEIHRWLHGLPPAVRSGINVRLAYLATVTELRLPHARKLKGECSGLLELRIRVQNVQYRPLGYYGPGRGEITLLIGAEERNDRFVPPDACASGLRRKQLVESDPVRCARDHDFS